MKFLPEIIILDRVIHHWLIRKLNPLFEDLFINDSYACRVGKGIHFGVQRLYHFIKSCSQNYKADSYILKLDVQGFFMHINRILLFNELEKFIHQRYKASDKMLVLEMTKILVFNNPIEQREIFTQLLKNKTELSKIKNQAN